MPHWCWSFWTRLRRSTKKSAIAGGCPRPSRAGRPQQERSEPDPSADDVAGTAAHADVRTHRRGNSRTARAYSGTGYRRSRIRTRHVDQPAPPPGDHHSAVRSGGCPQANANSIPHEMILLDLYRALWALDSLTGQTTSDDILNLIFSTFCIGK